MDWQLKEQLAQSIGTKSVTGIDVNQKITYGSAAVLSARVVEKIEMIDNFNSEVVKSSHSIVTEDAVDYDTHVWLPGDYTADPASYPETAARKPLKIIIAIDEDGAVDYYRFWV